MGKTIIAAATAKDRNSATRTFVPLRYLANNKAVVNFANSAGCSLNPPPIEIHARLPPTLRPITNTNIKSRVVITYNAGESRSYKPAFE